MAKRASEAVPTKAEARMLEAKLEMGSQPSLREQHSVGEVVGGYLADGEVRLSPATLEFYRKGQRAAADVQAAPGVDGDPAGARQPSAELATPARASKAIAELAERRDELDAALLEAVPSAVPSHRCSSGHPAGPSRIITA